MQNRSGWSIVTEVYAFLLLLPFLARYLLPFGIEELLIMRVGGLTFLMFDLSWLLAIPFMYFCGQKTPRWRIWLAGYFSVLCMLFALSVFMFGVAVVWQFNALFDTFLPLIFLSLCSLPHPIPRAARLLLVASFLVLCSQVIVFSFDWLQWRSDVATEYLGLGISRIRTSAGAATSTAIACFLLGCWSMELFRKRIGIETGLYVLMSITCILTMTRAVFIVWAIFSMAWLLFRLGKLRHGIKVLVPLTGLVLVIAAGLLTPMGESLLLRQVQAGETDVTTGRLDRFEDAINMALEMPWFGQGFGAIHSRTRTVWSENSGSLDPRPATLISVHNMYLSILAETGIVGSIMFWLPFLLIVVKVWRKKNDLLMLVAVTLVAVICGNTEAILLEYEFFGLLFMILLWMSDVPHVGSSLNRQVMVCGKEHP